MKAKTQRDRLLIIYLCFFLSGVAGLIYEILWNKYLALFIGSTGRAHVMTLAVFMGGLALGGAVFGRRADRIRNPLALYIALELAVGLWGMAYPLLFEPYRDGFIALARVLGLQSSALMTAKLVFCALTILLPTFLMGGTLPVLGRYLVGRLAEVGPRVATLYYVNTFGAFAGCLLAGFVMIPVYGLRWSMTMAAVLNFGVCVLAALLFQEKYRRIARGPEPERDRASGETAAARAEHEAAASEPVLYAPAIRRVALLTIGVSGFVAMLYEIAWIRLLTLVIGSSTYSFTLMVATFIFGIALGSFLLSFKRSERGYDTIYGLAELGLGLSVLAMLPLVEHVPYWFNRLVSLFAREPFAFGPYMFVQMLICFLLMLVPTVLLGMTLPAATRVVTERVSRVGTRVGTVYAWNTVGTLLGAALAGLVLLPTIGLKRTFEVGILVNFAIGLAILWGLGQRTAAAANPGGSWRSFRYVAVAACVLLFAGYRVAVPQWDQNILSSGVFRQRDRFASYQAMLDMLAERDRVVYYKDGVDASIAVVDSKGTRSLLINGKADASDKGDMSTQILLSHYPLLTRPDSRQILVIGLGSGVSVGSALRFPVEHVDAVEISKEVVEAATTHFARANFAFAADDRVTIHVEDAKTFLLLTPRVYDVIISEPTNPWIAGVAGLFSKEFFETCRDHLADDGLFLQWLHVYEIQNEALLSVLRTFTERFPYFVIWNMNRFDIALMGSPRPFQPHFEWMEKQFARPEVLSDLQRLGIEHPLAYLTTQLYANTAEPTGLFDAAVINSDFHPFLEHQAPVGFFAGSRALGIKSLDMRAWPSHSRRLWIDTYQPRRPPTPEQFAAFHRELGKTGSLFADGPAAWTDRWRETYPDDPRAVEAQIDARPDRLDWQREQIERAVERFPHDSRLADVHARLLVRLLESEALDSPALRRQAREAIERARAFHPKRQWPYARLLIEVAYREGNMQEVLEQGALAFPHRLSIREKEGAEAVYRLLAMIGEAAVVRGDRVVALECIGEMRRILPDHWRLYSLQTAVAQMENGPARTSP